MEVMSPVQPACSQRMPRSASGSPSTGSSLPDPLEVEPLGREPQSTSENPNIPGESWRCVFETARSPQPTVC